MDLLSATAQQWQAALDRGEVTSVDLVKQCFEQIRQHNKQGYSLHAIINTAHLEVAVESARILDEERSDGRVRSPLHGIPIIIKDIYPTDATLGMPTTCGAAALAFAVGRKNCALVDKLLAAGLIVIAKSNLTEFCGLRAKWMRMGLSAVGGQTQSPYVRGGLSEDDAPLGNTHIGGSSSGSAAAVAAGFAPIAIGSETSGSLVVPSNRAGLYSLKVTNSRAPVAGAHRLSIEYDSLGGMAKSARDLADITSVIVGGLSASYIPVSASHSSELPMQGFKVGFVDEATWRYSDGACSHTPESRLKVTGTYKAAIDQMSRAGAHVVTNIRLPDAGLLQYDGKPIVHNVAFSELEQLFKDFLGSLDHVPVKSLGELIEWNKEHAAESMPEPYANQIDLLAVLDTKLTDEQRNTAVALGVRLAGADGIVRALAEHDVELLLGPADSALYCLTAAAGFPIGTMPLSMIDFESDGKKQSRPDGLCIFGSANSDERILEFLQCYESVFQCRPKPTFE